MAPFDYDMAQILHKEIIDNGVDLILSDGVSTIEADKVILSSGKEVPTKAVIMAIGVTPKHHLRVREDLKLEKLVGLKLIITIKHLIHISMRWEMLLK